VSEHDDAKRHHRHAYELDDQDVHGNFPKIELAGRFRAKRMPVRVNKASKPDSGSDSIRAGKTPDLWGRG
jgi:hypothetical protein